MDAVRGVTTRLLALLTGLVAVSVALAQPSLAGADGPGAATLAVLVLALALLARLGIARGTVPDGPCGNARGRARTTPPVLTDRATDPVHHPLRPRAPGRG